MRIRSLAIAALTAGLLPHSAGRAAQSSPATQHRPLPSSDSLRPTFVADEFASMVDRLPSLVEFLPELRACLLQCPNATLPDSRSFLYWQDAQFGLKPTIRINKKSWLARVFR